MDEYKKDKKVPIKKEKNIGENAINKDQSYYRNTESGQYDDKDSLSNVQRVKVLSPGLLVIKRFLRNRLAIIGLVIILIMFLFSFIGGFFSPYDEAQVFKYIGTMSKEYVSVLLNDQYRAVRADETDYSQNAHSQFILAVNKGNKFFSDNDYTYYIREEGENFYSIFSLDLVATVNYFKNIINIAPNDGVEFGSEIEALIKHAIDQEEIDFLYNGNRYIITKDGRNYVLELAKNVAFESILMIDTSDDIDLTYDEKYIFLKTFINSESDVVEYNGETYEFAMEENFAIVYHIKDDGKEPRALISQYAMKAVSQDIFLSIEFKKEIIENITLDNLSFVYIDKSGSEKEYDVVKLNNTYTIKTITDTHLILIHDKPSSEHWLGTDQHGMDVITRLMYGGKISLVIGFIVVILEIIIGIIMGGIAGYFGKLVDMVIMRLVDVFNCIPFLPLLIIIGSVMDSLDVDPKIRIYWLMLILGVMSWPGIARMVRGQILSLREQEFMLAAEATGLKISRRIFKHLIPNVIPQLIVIATLGLGGIIIYESTLSFLGLGVKFPYASWGNIISGVSTAYEMTNFWFVWIPAGMLILLTVLGFNFIGDGLRDAFDPKMKR